MPTPDTSDRLDGTTPDPYEWLEELTSDRALTWVRERNDHALEALSGTETFAEYREGIRAVLDAADRIPYVRRRGAYLYNFWQDADHPKGRWRRTTLEDYRTDRPRWDVLLDVDALAAAEDENWVWQGASLLRPSLHRALIELSHGGADATVVREFDLETRSFVEDGFRLPEAKSDVGWIDEDRIYVGTDFGPGSLTSSGYPRLVKEWRRGTDLSEATVVFEGKPGDVVAYASHDATEGFERDFVGRRIDFYTSEEFLRTADGRLHRLDVPDDADTDVHREWLLISLRSDWSVGGRTYVSGSLLAVDFDAFMGGDRELTVLFEPDERTSLSYYATTRHHLVLNTLSDVKSRLEVLTHGPDGWVRRELAGLPAVASSDIVSTDQHAGDEIFVDSSGFTEPSTLRVGDLGVDGIDARLEVVKQQPSFFDTTGLEVEQFFATSADGTRVPYFVIGRPDRRGGPTLLNGYGGFEVSLTPGYSGSIGRAWLAAGGTYVVANIRGGGEYGPRWHQNAVKANRHLVYEDFAAVAEDLVTRGITTAARLGIQGGSNGGLLMGVMLTHYPELVGAIVCQVPLLDMARYHRLLAGASWMAEYGDPDDEGEWAYLREFSPYHQVRADRPYPPVLFLSSTRDDRVHPAHARKMVAKMRELGCDVTYYENIEGGHGGAADNEQRAFKAALTYEFLWTRLGGEASA